MTEKPSLPSATLPPPEPEQIPNPASRAWAEPRVRLWWVTALVLAAVAAYVGYTQMVEWYKEARLIRRGTPVTTKVVSANDKERLGNSQPGDSFVVLGFDWHGQPQTASGYLADRPPSQFIKIGDKIDITVDPQNPAFWTSRHHPAPLSTDLGLPLAVMTAATLVGAASWMLQRSVIRSYRHGTRAPARVISRFRSALAPRSWATRCVLLESGDKRIFTVYIPPQFPRTQGESIEVILPPPSGRGYRPLAAAWFE